MIAKEKNLSQKHKSVLNLLSFCHYGNSIILFCLALYFLLIPFFLIVYYLSDNNLKTEKIPKFAINIHRSLSKRYEEWALERLRGGQARKLTTEQIAETEWPVFGSTFYLLATEALQNEWEIDNSISDSAPNEYAAEAIEAAAALVIDPNHAAWVKKHWGEDYLQKENVFYRMLIIHSLTCHYKLTGSDKYIQILRKQVESLSEELDNSMYGLLDDYPGQCYPADVMAAIAAIKNTDDVLGTNHQPFLERAVRGFEGDRLTPSGLVPYYCYLYTNGSKPIAGDDRGCSNAWAGIWAPYLWSKKAKQWYEISGKRFWQERYGFGGFREFSKDSTKNGWYYDVDSGPVIGGFGASACAFGIGAARANGRLDHAYPMSAMAIICSWPLPDGTLIIPRMLSNTAHAPYLGEASLLFVLTRKPADGFDITKPEKFFAAIYLGSAVYLLLAVVFIADSLRRFLGCPKKLSTFHYPFAKAQFIIWIGFIITAIITISLGLIAQGMIMLLLAHFLPRGKKIKKDLNVQKIEPATNK